MGLRPPARAPGWGGRGIPAWSAPLTLGILGRMGTMPEVIEIQDDSEDEGDNRSAAMEVEDTEEPPPLPLDDDPDPGEQPPATNGACESVHYIIRFALSARRLDRIAAEAWDARAGTLLVPKPEAQEKATPSEVPAQGTEGGKGGRVNDGAAAAEGKEAARGEGEGAREGRVDDDAAAEEKEAPPAQVPPLSSSDSDHDLLNSEEEEEVRPRDDDDLTTGVLWWVGWGPCGSTYS
jgi:hypothetical protein